MFAVAHPLVGSRLLARFSGPLIEWVPQRDETSWFSERKDARAAFRLAWQASAAERRYRLDLFREEERAAREAAQAAQDAESHADADGSRRAGEGDLLRELSRIEASRKAAEDKADDAWLDLGSEAVLFEKPDSLLTSPGFALFGFVKEGGQWAGFDWSGQVEFSDSGSRIALFQTEEMAGLWAKEHLKEHPDAALATLRAEFSNLRPIFAAEAKQSHQWISDVLEQQGGAVEPPTPPRAQEPSPMDRRKGRPPALGKKEKKEARDRASGRFDAALIAPAAPAKERKANRSQRAKAPSPSGNA